MNSWPPRRRGSNRFHSCRHPYPEILPRRQRSSSARCSILTRRLSASHAISCNSCHNVGLGGVDAEETSIGHQWQRGGRNAPTVLNAVFNTAQFWDGRAKDLEAQAGGPMVNPIEMASPKEHVGEQLGGHPGVCHGIQSCLPGGRETLSPWRTHRRQLQSSRRRSSRRTPHLIAT